MSAHSSSSGSPFPLTLSHCALGCASTPVPVVVMWPRPGQSKHYSYPIVTNGSGIDTQGNPIKANPCTFVRIGENKGLPSGIVDCKDERSLGLPGATPYRDTANRERETKRRPAVREMSNPGYTIWAQDLARPLGSLVMGVNTFAFLLKPDSVWLPLHMQQKDS